MHAPRQPHAVTQKTAVCVFLVLFLFLSLFYFFEDVAFSEYFRTIAVLFCMESTSYVFSLPYGNFLPCDHGLEF